MNRNPISPLVILLLNLVLVQSGFCAGNSQESRRPTSMTVADVMVSLNSIDPEEKVITKEYLTGIVDSAFHLNMMTIGNTIEPDEHCFAGYYKNNLDKKISVYNLKKEESLNLAVKIINGANHKDDSVAVAIEAHLRSLFPCTGPTFAADKCS